MAGSESFRRGYRSRYDELGGVLHRHRRRTVAGPHLGHSQVVAPGEVEARETLPSFHYEAAAGEFSRVPCDCRYYRAALYSGHLARDHGATVPGRMIASVKSWLCHSGVDRTAAILPARRLRRRAAVTRRREQPLPGAYRCGVEHAVSRASPRGRR